MAESQDRGEDTTAAAEPRVIPPEERQMAMFVHLSALVGALLTAGWGCFVGPLIIWLIKKDTMPFVDDQGKESLNFNITALIILLGLVLISIGTLGIGLLLAVPLGFVVAIAWLIFTIVAAVKANEGVAWRFPIAWRLIR